MLTEQAILTAWEPSGKKTPSCCRNSRKAAGSGMTLLLKATSLKLGYQALNWHAMMWSGSITIRCWTKRPEAWLVIATCLAFPLTPDNLWSEIYLQVEQHAVLAPMC